MNKDKKVTIEYNGIVIEILTDKQKNQSLFINFDGYTYYIDNSTNEQIMESWQDIDFNDELPD